MTAWMAWFLATAALMVLWILGANALDAMKRRWSK